MLCGFREEGADEVLGVREEGHCVGVPSGRGAEGGGHDQKKVPFIRDGALGKCWC